MRPSASASFRKIIRIGQPADPAHLIKNATRDTLMPRGGSGRRRNWTGIRRLGQTMRSNPALAGQIRGVPFEPIKLELMVVKPEGLVDAEGNHMPCTVIQPMGEHGRLNSSTRQRADSRRSCHLSSTIQRSCDRTLRRQLVRPNRLRKHCRRPCGSKMDHVSGPRLYRTTDGLRVSNDEPIQ